MFYKWGGSDILSISTFNHYSRILKVVAVILLQKKYGIIWESFPTWGGGLPKSQHFCKFTKYFFCMPNSFWGVKHVYNGGEVISDQFVHFIIIQRYSLIIAMIWFKNKIRYFLGSFPKRGGSPIPKSRS